MKNPLRILVFSLAALLGLPARDGLAASYTWIGTSGGNWSTAANWTGSSAAPTTSDTANIASVSANQTVIYDSAASGAVTALNIEQNSAGITNMLQVCANLSVTSSTLSLGAASGTSVLYLDGQDISGTAGGGGAVKLTAGNGSGTLAVSSGGFLLMSTGGANNAYTPYVYGSVNLSGGVIWTTSGMTAAGAVSYFNSNFTMTGGTLIVGGTGTVNGVSFGSAAGGASPRLQINGTTNITSGVIACASGQLVLNGSGTSVIKGLSATSSSIGAVSFYYGGDQTLVTDESTANAYLKSVIARNVNSGTYTKTIGSTSGTLSLSNGIAFGEGVSNSGVILKFSSDVLIAYSNPVSVQFGMTTGTQNFSIDLNGHNFFNTTGALATANYSASCVTNWAYYNSASATTGTIVAPYFNFSSGNSVNLGYNAAGVLQDGTLVLTATAGNNAANNLGSSGTISANTLFSYIGSGSASLSAVRALGRLSVGNGSSASILNLLASSTLTLQGDLKVNTNSILNLQDGLVTETGSTAGVGGLNGGGAIYNNGGGGTSVLTLNTANGNGSFSGVIGDHTTGSGKVAVTKNGAGTQILSGSNSYTGATTVAAGELDINGSIANASAVTVQAGATLGGSGTANGTVSVQSGAVNGNGLHLGAATFDGQSTISGTTTASSITVNTGTTSASGVTTSTGNLSVAAGATLKNTGTVSANIVNVANTATLTNNGTLSGPVNVSGLLNGTGTINGALTIKTNGELAPGNSPGMTTVSGSLTVETGAKISMQIEGTTTAGGDYDQIVVTGASSLVTLNAGSILNLTIADGVFTSGSLTLIENQSGNAIVGTFSMVVIGGSSYDLGGTNTFTYNGKEYQLNYNVNADNGTTANDLELTVVPEPGAWALLMGGAGLLAFGRQWKRRARRG